MKIKMALAASLLIIGNGTTIADQVILDDLIIDGSTCVGMDCVNGESFGFDTLRLKENNLRIRAVDTSSTASFPSNDWQITFNDSSNGGANKFSIDDIDGGRTPFTIEAGAPSNALYVDDSGRVGFGTSTPVVDLHTLSGNTPTLRLAQDGSSGFTPQTWDVAGNEANFFIRDATNGSRLPFKILPGAATNSLVIDAAGEIGIGTNAPASALHIQKSDGTAKLFVQETNSTTTYREMARLENNGPAAMVMVNLSYAHGWALNSNDTFRISDDDDGIQEFVLDKDGNLEIAGTLTESSSANLKENFEEVDASEVLAKLKALPITRWNFKANPEAKRVGPMAQDFAKAFGLGKDDTKIATLDVGGIALAAIKGLSESIDKKDTEIASLKWQIAELRSMIEGQKKVLNNLVDHQTHERSYGVSFDYHEAAEKMAKPM